MKVLPRLENVMVCQADSFTGPVTLKKVVKTVVQGEDRSRIVVIFGLTGKKDENIEELPNQVVP